VFDEKKASRVCLFIEQMPHTKGKWAVPGPDRDTRIRLENWQCFVLCCIFGWTLRASGFRRFRYAYICVPRKNGKSILAAGIGNYMFAADGEFGAEVYSGATTELQAWEVFRPARLQWERTERMAGHFGVEINAKSLIIPANGSRFVPVIGKPGDGASPSCAIIDEYHEHLDDTLYDTMVTGMAAREQPLALVITTAGSNLAGPCFAMQSAVQKVLEGTQADDRTFGIIYSIDSGDDWTKEAALRKSNPNYGVSVFPDFILAEQHKAVESSRKQNVFKTKHENVWCNSKTAWMNMQRWMALADENLRPEQFIGCRLVMSADIGTKVDITATCKLFEKFDDAGKPHYYPFLRFYLPEERANAPECQHYLGWKHDGKLTATEGNMIDFAVIREDTVKDIADFHAKEFCFDPWNAAMLAQQINVETFIEIVEVPQTVKSLSDAMKSLEALVLDGRIHHDGDPILTWMMSNVVAHLDAKDNIYPRKEAPENKIDGVVALITALTRMAGGEQSIAGFTPFFVD
jgi:phage terminase large subunit-like protein